MNLLNYWHDYIKGKIETLTNDMNTRFGAVGQNITSLQKTCSDLQTGINRINNFNLKKYEFNITITGLASDSTMTTYGTLNRNEYFLGIESITLSEELAGNINLDVNRFFTDSDGNIGYGMTITNNTAREYNGTVTVKLVCLVLS